MPRLRRSLPVLAIALALGSTGPAFAGAPPKTVLHLGDQAPRFFLPVVDAKAAGLNRVVLDDWYEPGKSKAVLISFFATWCHPCKRELPHLEALYEKYKGQGLKVVVVSIDRDPKAVAGLPAFLAKRGLTFPVVSDRFNLLARRYLGTSTALPSLFITDGAGKILTIRQSFTKGAAAALEAAVRKALGLAPLAAKAGPAKTGKAGAATPAKAGAARTGKARASARRAAR